MPRRRADSTFGSRIPAEARPRDAPPRRPGPGRSARPLTRTNTGLALPGRDDRRPSRVRRPCGAARPRPRGRARPRRPRPPAPSRTARAAARHVRTLRSTGRLTWSLPRARAPGSGRRRLPARRALRGVLAQPRPRMRIPPGVSDSRKRTFCILTGPSSGRPTVTIDCQRLVLRVGEHVGDVVDRGDRGSALLERLDDLVARRAAAIQAPTASSSSSACSARVGARGEPRLVDELGPPDQPHHALGDRLGAGGDRDPAAVRASGRCCAARCSPSGCRCRCCTIAELVVDGRLRAEHRQDRLDDREVDDLPAPGPGRGHGAPS